MTDLVPKPAVERTPVMADVARLAGVSHQTVSRVVNDHPNLRPETRERVQRAIEQLGYRPNTAARALVTRRSGTIGVIGSKSGYWGPSTVHRTVQAAARAAGFFVSSVNLPALTRTEVVDAIDHLRSQGVEGVVLIAATDEALDVARSHQAAGLPVVVVEGDETKARWTVGVDQVRGAAMATEHLLGLGHTEIVHIAGPQSWTEARARLAGYQEAMYSAGLRPAPPLIGDWSARSGFALGCDDIVARHDVTAVFCANDQMALGLLRALHESGRRVPEDVSVVGFDDIPEAAFLIPPLTSVRQDFGAVGRRAIEILRAVIEGQTPPESLISPELVVRTSSVVPPVRK
ncbi:LacI family DNA-binding transcriptional regulator [Nocardioides flavescens]|nr:LacI family DNA-binding transcriptional regulator [Nocardioides flavescens]